MKKSKTNYSDLLVEGIQMHLKALDRSPAWLAKQAKMSPGTLYHILNKERSASLVTLEIIEKGLKLNPGDLLRESHESAK